MRPTKILLTCALAGAMTACSSSERGSVRTPPADSTSGENLRREAREAWQALRDYALDRKEQYREKVNATLANFDRRLDSLKTRTESLTANAREGWNEAADDLRIKRQNLAARLDRLKGATAETWEDFKRGMGDAADELEVAYDRAAARWR